MDAKDSCVFHRNWLEAAHTIQDEKLRCYFFEAVLQYALDGMKMDVPRELEFGLGIIYSLIDIDKAKYERKIEKRREAGINGANKRWQKEANDSKNGKCHNSIANIADTATVTETGTETDTATVRNNVSINPPIAPKGASEAGKGLDLEGLFHKVRETVIPKAISDLQYETQYAWRMADGNPGYAVEISKAIARGGGREKLTAEIQRINQTVQPSTPYPAIKLAMTMTRLKTRQQLEAVMEEARRSASEPDIFAILTAKAEYIIQGNRVNNLRAFMQARK